MKALAAALALALTFSVPARAAAMGAPPYDAKAAPLDDLSSDLLASNGYEVRDDGKVWDKIGDVAVTVDAMPELLTRLAGARRLKALLQLNAIFNRYDSERLLSADDREAVRGLVRGAWSVFGPEPRRDFRSYFTPQELEALDKIPVYSAPGVTDMKDPDTSITAGPAAAAPGASITAAPPAAPAAAAALAPGVSITAAPPAAPAVSITAAPPAVSSAAVAAAAPAVSTAPAVAGAAAAAAAAGAAAVVTPAVAAAPDAAAAAGAAVAAGAATLTPLMAPPSLHRLSPFVASAPPQTAAPRAVPVADVKFIPFTAPSGSTSTAVSPKAVDPNAGEFKAWTPPALSTAAAAAAAKSSAAVAAAPAPAPAAARAAAPPPPPPPKPIVVAAVGPDEYAKFVEDGPYSRESKELLKLIGQRAPDYCLPLLRRTVATTVPQIIIDGRRTGTSLRAGIMRDASNLELPPIIALSPGPVFVERKDGLFSPREALLLAEAPEAWAELGVPAPSLIAMSGQPPTVPETNGPWGVTRSYADGSKRGTYNPQEQAGELLEQLLLLGLRREGFSASEYAARRWARTAKLLFWSKVNDDFGHAFLDPDRRAEFENWLDHPDELDDVLTAQWASAREPVLDPRAGPPVDQRAFEEKQSRTCEVAAVEAALVATVRRRVRRIGLLEQLIDAELVDPAAAKASAQASADAELSQRRELAAHPPACAAVDPYRGEALRKSGVLLAEAARAEAALRSRRAEAGGAHASR